MARGNSRNGSVPVMSAHPIGQSVIDMTSVRRHAASDTADATSGRGILNAHHSWLATALCFPNILRFDVSFRREFSSIVIGQCFAVHPFAPAHPCLMHSWRIQSCWLTCSLPVATRDICTQRNASSLHTAVSIALCRQERYLRAQVYPDIEPPTARFPRPSA